MELAELAITTAAGLLGALIGAGAGILMTYVTLKDQARLEEQRWRREDKSRFHMDRRQLYARFMALIQDIYYLALEHGMRLHSDSPEFRAGAPEVGSKIAKGLADLLQIGEEINLVGSDRVVKATKEIAVLGIMWRTVVYLPNNKQMLDERYREFLDKAKPEFLSAAREELGIDTK